MGKAAVCPEKYLGNKFWPYQVAKVLKNESEQIKDINNDVTCC